MLYYFRGGEDESKHAVQAWMKEGIISIPSFYFNFIKKLD